MKILLDMQGAQCQSRHRGIGRYTLDLAKALGPLAAAQHDLHFAFNAQLDDATDDIIAALAPHADVDHRLIVPSLRDVSAQGAGNVARRRAAEMLVRHALEQSRSDVVWHSSMIEGYIDDAVISGELVRNAFSVGTLYDLIPLHDPQSLLGHPRVDAWYRDKLKALSQCHLLLAISEWVRSDAIDRLGIDPDRVVTIGGGVDPRFRPPLDPEAQRRRVSNAYAITRPYVLYNGGLDARKNVAQLIRAYAALPVPLRDDHQLVIVGKATTEQTTVLNNAIRRAGLPANAVVLTGYVADEALVDLYGSCALFVFPSSMEGFGLPPLEAMACGAPVIASNTTSLPEVIGKTDALFDPSSIEAIAAKMAEVLTQPARLAELREHGIRRASQFTWTSVAARALKALEGLGQSLSSPMSPSGRLDPPTLLCLHEATTPPPWLSQLTDRYRISAERLPVNISEMSTPLRSRLDASDRVLYTADPAHAWRLAAWLQAWPGAALLAPDADASIRRDGLALRYQGAGYVACLDEERSSFAPCWDGCMGVFLGDGVASMPDAVGMPVATLPTDAEPGTFFSHLEAWHADAWSTRESDLLDDLASNAAAALNDNELACLSDGIVASRPRPSTRQWLVDVTQVARGDIGTGVQRVVRSILLHWLGSPPEGIRIEPIAYVDGHFRYARQYTLALLDIHPDSLDDDFVEVRPGDLFVGLDWSAETMEATEPLLRDWHRRGVGMHFVVHDLLPLSLPEAFHPFARDLFAEWLRRISSLADGLHCVSRATARELVRWLADDHVSFQFGRIPIVDSFHLGVEINAPSERGPLPHLLGTAMAQRPTLLMVGTLEPRKGHAQALDAIERLWAWGQELNLVIVGHHGWMVETLTSRLARHEERDQRLFWLEDADDALLETLYGASTALLAPSLGEGYGLPLVEAAHRKLPVIARDLPVFREVMGDYPHYFSATSSAALAEVITTWLVTPRRQASPGAWPTWQQSATALASRIAQPAGPAPESRVQTIV